MPIRPLPDELINRIAAGEVVERPASAVKELVENAIDAGAQKITVTTSGGGKSLIRIADDGCGMDEADLRLSIARHATSKLLEDDLEDIRTLGFRGEALASIGSVADLVIASRPRNAPSGLKLSMRGGQRADISPSAMNRGTVIEVRDLFARVPARLKFLKSDRAESQAITDVVKRLALANPHVHFVLDGADRTEQNWPATGGGAAMRARIAQIMGTEFTDNAMELGLAREGIVVAGLAGLPTFTRANSLHQFFFVNGRAVRDKVLVGAVRAAYQDYVFRDRFPVIALFVSVDPAMVDVNVHPAKTELRFRDAGAVRGGVIRALYNALEAAGIRANSSLAERTLSAFRVPGSPPPQPKEPGGHDLGSTTPARDAGAIVATDPLGANGTKFWDDQAAMMFEPSARYEPGPDMAKPEVQAEAEAFALGGARAQLFENYILSQRGDALLLVDQHAAHERLVYERFKRAMQAGPVAAQSHLIPVVVELPQEDCERLEEAAGELERFGLVLERFGTDAIAVSSTPAILGQADVSGLVRDLADGLAEWGHANALRERVEAVLGRMACHGSVRSGRRLTVEEMNALLRQMEAEPHSGQCIHGRPTYVELKFDDLERLFGRA